MQDSAYLYQFVNRLVYAGLCAGALFLLEVSLPAAAPKSDNDGVATPRDVQLTVFARKALLEEKALVPLNLGVSVRNGVARLWGAVPSGDLILLAKKRVESVQGILDVHCDELYVAKPENKIEPLAIPLSIDEPLRSESASPDPISGLPGALTGRTMKVSEILPNATPVVPPACKVELAPPIPVLVMPEKAAPTPEKPAPVKPATALSPRLGSSSHETLSRSIDQLRQNNPRFRTLRTEIREGVVIIAGNAEQEEDVMALASAVSRFPGVNRVVTKTDEPAR